MYLSADKLCAPRSAVGRPNAAQTQEHFARRAEYERLRCLNSLNPLALSVDEILFNRQPRPDPLADDKEQQQQQLAVSQVKDLSSHEAEMTSASSVGATDASRESVQQHASVVPSQSASVEPIRPLWAKKNQILRSSTTPAARAILQSRLLKELVHHKPSIEKPIADPLHWFHALRKLE